MRKLIEEYYAIKICNKCMLAPYSEIENRLLCHVRGKMIKSIWILFNENSNSEYGDKNFEIISNEYETFINVTNSCYAEITGKFNIVEIAFVDWLILLSFILVYVIRWILVWLLPCRRERSVNGLRIHRSRTVYMHVEYTAVINH